jgi:hypothetical protein
MKPIAKKDIQINETFYSKGDEIEVDNIEQLQKLNERGFIEPLTQKQIQDYFKKDNKKF